MKFKLKTVSKGISSNKCQSLQKGQQADCFTTDLRDTYIKKTSAFEFIQSWIEEAKSRKPFEEALVINEWEDSSNHWSWSLEQKQWNYYPILQAVQSSSFIN